MGNDLAVWQLKVHEASPYLKKTIEESQAIIEAGFALQILQGNDKLQKCEPQSIYNAVINIGRCGITLNPALKLAYLVPRDGKCVLDISYMGLREILIRAGVVRQLTGTVVYNDEEFDMEKGLEPLLKHKPRSGDILTWEQQKKRVKIGCYTVAVLANGMKDFEWMNAGEIEGIKLKSVKALGKGFSPWEVPEYEGEMWKKTVLRRHSKAFPKMMIKDPVLKAQFEAAMEIDAENAKAEHTKKDDSAAVLEAVFDIPQESDGEVHEGEVQVV